MLPDDALNQGSGHQVRETVSAQQDRGVDRERRLHDFHELLIVLVAKGAADVAKHLVAARVPHRVELGHLAPIFTLADR